MCPQLKTKKNKNLDFSLIEFVFTLVECYESEFCCNKGDEGCHGRCISKDLVNNGKDDCPNGSDEMIGTVSTKSFQH